MTWLYYLSKTVTTHHPHPSLMPLEPALEITPLVNRDFYSESTGSIDDELQWASVVFYASSTVCLEAVSLGIPVMYVDLGFHVVTDPMVGWSKFKWVVKESSEVVGAIQQIESLSEEAFNRLQEEGRKYAESYLLPVTAGGLARFWDS